MTTPTSELCSQHGEPHPCTTCWPAFEPLLRRIEELESRPVLTGDEVKRYLAAELPRALDEAFRGLAQRGQRM